MKRLAAFVLCLCLLAVLFGCDTHSTPAETTAPTETAAPTETTAPTEPEAPAERSLCAISLPREFRYTTADYWNVMTASYPRPSLLHGNEAAAAAVVADLQHRVAQAQAEGDSVLSLAQDAYAATGVAPDYSYEMLCDVKRFDEKLLSMLTVCRSYTGGAHGGHITEAVTYDLTTGTLLNLSDVLTGDISSVTPLLLDQLSKEDGLYPSYEADALDILNREGGPSNWYLSETGLAFFFDPYEIAPYATGTVIAEIPYAKLNGILNERFYPTQKEYADGMMNAILYADADLTSIERCAELVTEPEGTEILLYPSGTVTDLRIDQGYWDMDGICFFADSTVFASPQLSSGDAIMVTTMVPEIMPNLRIQYTANGETVTQYLLLSGKDGSALLIE